MPNDAKLGLIIGVGLVIGVAVLFMRKDGATDPKAPSAESPPAVSQPASSLPRGAGRATTAAREKSPSPAEGQPEKPE